MSEHDILRELQRKYDASNHDLGLFIRSLKVMTHLAKRQYGLDADWLCDAALHHLSAKTKTYIEDKRIGLLAVLMVGHGSSFNQAMLAIGEWMGIGDTKIKKAYLAVCDEYKLPRDERNLKNSAFMERAEGIPYIMTIREEKPFPICHEKAWAAFRKAYQIAEDSHVEQVFQMARKARNDKITLADVEERKDIIRQINQSYLL